MNMIKTSRDFYDNDKIFVLNEIAFPEEERMPSSKIYDFVGQYHCDMYAFYENNEFIGYTIIMVSHDDHIGYLWYLAIEPNKQNQGYGSKALQALSDIYKDITIVLDMEQVDAPCDNQAQRQKRLEFYVRNGYVRSYTGMSYFGVDYELLCNNESFDIKNFQNMINRVKGNGWNPVFYPLEKKVYE